MKHVYVSRRVPDPVRRALERSFAVSVHDSEQPPERAELLERIAGVDGVVTMLTDRVDDEFLDAAGTRLRIVANYAVGYDNVDLEACARRGVVVANTPDVLTRATAELTLALILSLTRRVTEGDRFVRRREPWIWAPTFMIGSGLAGRLLGIVGLGRIGLEVARLAEAFGMRVAYSDEAARKATAYEWLPLEELLARSDIVSLHTPLTPATWHLIDRRALELMRPSAYLVNTSRGPVVDEEALADALEAGSIAGAALDVFEQEPVISERLLHLDNVVLTPHLGSATADTREAMGMLCVEALRAVLLEERTPENAVRPPEAAAAP